MRIFASHGGEVAHKLLGALERQGLIADFVDAYVVEHGRLGLKSDPGRYRELEVTLGREALLAMAAQVTSQLPRHLTRRRPPVLRGPEVQAAAAFHQELLAALGRALRWSEEDAAEFRRDLEMYKHLNAPASPAKSRRKPLEPAQGPFVDRCALLLDPAMMEKARRAAGKFRAELERATDKILKSLFRPRR